MTLWILRTMNLNLLSFLKNLIYIYCHKQFSVEKDDPDEENPDEENPEEGQKDSSFFKE